MAKTQWQDTGSSVTGERYGYVILTAGFGSNEYAVRLRLHQRAEIVPVPSYVEACEMGRAFNHACRMWLNVQARERAMQQGFAVLG